MVRRSVTRVNFPVSVVHVDVKVQVSGETKPRDVRPKQDGTDFSDGPGPNGVPDDQPVENDDTDQTV